MALTTTAIRAAKPRPSRYKLTDGDGLYLLVLPSGVKSWRWRHQEGGREKTVTLGQYPAMALAEARRARDEARKGQAASPTRTLAAVAADWLAAQAPVWKPHHAADVKASLDREMMPTLGARPLASIAAPDILAALRPIQARGAVELAHRLRQRLAALYAFAIASGEATINPAAGIEAALMPVIRQGRRPAVLTMDAAREALQAADATPAHPITHLAHRLLALTVLRPGELRAGRWAEIEGDTWRVPAARMKGTTARAALASDHLVPLSRQALEHLEVLRPFAPGALMFPSWSAINRPISENALGLLLRRAGLDGVQVPHGWRATFSTLMNEAFPADRAAIDLMLAHTPQGVEAAYNRAAHTVRRRELAQAWADMLMEGAVPVGDLVAGRRKR